MASKFNASQLRSKLNQLQNKQRQAVRNYNTAVNNYNRNLRTAVNNYNQAINKYNQAVRAHNANVIHNRAAINSQLRQLQSTSTTTRVQSIYRTSSLTMNSSYNNVIKVSDLDCQLQIGQKL